MSRYLPANLAAFWAVLVLAIPFSMAFIDQPLAQFFWPCQSLRPAFNICAAPSLLALPLSGLYLAWLVVQKLRGRSPQNSLWLSVAIATIAATAAKDELKWMFGRSWPQFWLKDGIYGFQPFSNSFFYGSFPSGHTAYISAPLAVLWALRPQWRPACAGLTLLVMFGLVAADYHYFADVLAGLLTGTGCAWATLVLLKPRHVL